MMNIRLNCVGVLTVSNLIILTVDLFESARQACKPTDTMIIWFYLIFI